MMFLDNLWEVLIRIILIGMFLYFIYECLIKDNFTKKEDTEINGIKLGDMFKLICEIDDQTRLYLDTQTMFMYLMCDSGITPVLDSKGKPRKYEEFLSSIKGKDNNNE